MANAFNLECLGALVSSPATVVQDTTYGGPGNASTGTVTNPENEPKRRVTDQNWLVAFSVFMLFCSFFVMLAFTEGSPARLYKGMNYQGKTCGVDPEVRDLPYLYYPLDPRESFASIMISDARCVAKCPTEEDVENGLTIPTPIRETSIDSARTSAITAEYLLLSPAYAATLMADAYCIPLDPSLRSQLVPALNNTFRQMQFAIGSFVNSWGCVFGYLFLAVFVSIIFSASMRLSPGLLFGSAAAGSIGLAFLAGGVLIRSGFSGVLDQDKGNFFSLDYTLAMFVSSLVPSLCLPYWPSQSFCHLCIKFKCIQLYLICSPLLIPALLLRLSTTHFIFTPLPLT